MVVRIYVFVIFRQDPNNAEDAFRHRDRMLRLEHEREIQGLIQPMLNLRTIKLVSRVTVRYLILILSQCLNVTEIFMGMNTDISDESIGEILVKNPLQDLEELTIQRSKFMTIAGINMILDHCNKLKVRGKCVHLFRAMKNTVDTYLGNHFLSPE